MAADSFVYKIVALTVFVLIAATVLVPVVDDVTEKIKTAANNETYTYSMTATNTEDVTITLDGANVVVNGDSTPRPAFNIIMANESFVIGVGSNASTIMTIIMADGTMISTISKVVWSNGDLIYTVSSVDTTISDIGNVYYISPTGDYGYYFGNSEFNISKGKSVLVASFAAFINNANPPGGVYVGVYNNGDIESKFGYTWDSGTSALVNPTSATWSATVEDNTVNYGVSSITLSVVASGVTYNYGDTYVVAFAPIEYDELTNDDLMARSLFNIIPILVIIAAVMIAVGLLRGKS